MDRRKELILIKRIVKSCLVIILCLSISGCALIQAPFTIVQQILKLAIKIVEKAPKPPPGVF